MTRHLIYLARINWCRLTGGHRPIIHRSLVDGAPLSIRCTRCPLFEAGE